MEINIDGFIIAEDYYLNDDHRKQRTELPNYRFTILKDWGHDKRIVHVCDDKVYVEEYHWDDDDNLIVIPVATYELK